MLPFRDSVAFHRIEWEAGCSHKRRVRLWVVLVVGQPKQPWVAFKVPPMAQQYSKQPDLSIDLAKSYSALLDTNHGPITIALNPDRAPQTVNNFVFLANEGFYERV